MRFIKKWSYGCANHFTAIMNENHEKRAVYYYGFFIIISTIVKVIILLSAALIFRTLIPTLIIVFIFSSFRMLAGGYHMDTYGKCLLVSLILYIAASVITQYTYKYWSLTYIVIVILFTFLIGLYILIRYAPKDTPNKPITDPIQIKKYKKWSLIFLVSWFILSIIFTVFDLKMLVIAMTFGILLELFTLTPIGHKIFDVFN